MVAVKNSMFPNHPKHENEKVEEEKKVQIEVTLPSLHGETSLWNYPDQFFILNSFSLQNSI